MARKKPAPDLAAEKPAEPTPADLAAIDRFVDRRKAAAPRPKMKALGPGKMTVDHPYAPGGWALMAESVGTDDQTFLHGMVDQLVQALSKGREPDYDAINFGLSVIQGVQPRDQLEAMLAAQMAAIHMATMTFSRRLLNVDNIPQQDSAERALNKLTRTFAMQLEALDKHRRGGQQTVKVEHVHIAAGGQAIVGNVTPGGAGPSSNSGQPYGQALEYSPGAPVPSMWGQDQARDAVPVAGDAGKAAL